MKKNRIILTLVLVFVIFLLFFTPFGVSCYSLVGDFCGVFQKKPVNISYCFKGNLNSLKEKQNNQFIWKTEKQEYMHPLLFLDKTQIFVKGNCESNFGYHEFNLLTGKKQETFPNMPKVEYAEEKILIDSRISTQQSSSLNQTYYICSKQKVTAIQTFPKGNKVLWEHKLPFNGGNTTEFSSWNGIEQYDDIIVYTAFTVVYKKTVKDICVKAISKETGEVVWEVENPSSAYGQSIIFKERKTGATPKIGNMYLFEIVCPIEDFSIEKKDTIYAYNTETKRLQWKKKLGIEPYHLIMNQNPRMYYYGETFFSIMFGKYSYYGLNAQTGRKIDKGCAPIIYGDILNGVTNKRLYLTEEKSNKFYSLQKFSKKPVWFADNATGYSSVLKDSTMVLILENRYICHVDADSGELLKYWDVKELIGDEYVCSSMENYTGNKGHNCFTISEEGNVYILVKGKYLDTEDGYGDRFQELLAISLE